MWPISGAVSVTPAPSDRPRDILGTPGDPGVVLWLGVSRGAESSVPVTSPLALGQAQGFGPWGRPQVALFAGALTASPWRTSPGRRSAWECLLVTRQPDKFMVVSCVSHW